MSLLSDSPSNLVKADSTIVASWIEPNSITFFSGDGLVDISQQTHFKWDYEELVSTIQTVYLFATIHTYGTLARAEMSAICFAYKINNN